MIINGQMLDLVVPHFSAVVEWADPADVEAHQDHVGVSVGKSSIFVMVPKRVP